MTTAVICLLGLAACSGGDPESTTPEPASADATAEAPPRLEEEWSTPAEGLLGVGAFRMTPDVLALTSRKSLSGFDRRTGEKRWTMTPPGDLNEICFTSEQVSPDGIVGVLMAGRGRDCTVAGAVDLKNGKLLWTRTMPSAPPYHSGHGVAVGDTTLTAEMFCDEVRRFSLKDGKPLRTLAPRDRKCAMESASNGQLIAVLNDPVTPRTPDDHGTGWIPPVEESAGMELYDADSGRLLWRRTVSNSGASVNDVVSAQPTILTRTLRDHKLTQIYGPGGRPGPYLGMQLPALGEETLQVLGHPDGLLVATYPADGFGGSQVVYGYDDRTGEERWRLPLTDGWQAVGVHGGGVLVAGASNSEDGPEQWLTRHDLDDPSEVETLGSVGGDVLAADDTAVYAGTPDGIKAYSLPESGTDGAPELANPSAPEWAEDDVRPEDVAGACDAITPKTLAMLGFRSPTLPRPANCHFGEYSEPEYTTRELVVWVQVVPPSTTAEGEVSATEAAAEAVAADASGSRSPTPADRVLGDESWSSLDRAGNESAGAVVARWRNVIVTVTASQEVLLGDRRGLSVPAGELPDIAYAAAAQVLEAIGAQVGATP